VALHRYARLALFALAWLGVTGVRAEPREQNLHLLGRSDAVHLQVTPDAAQQAWLNGHERLVLGTSAPDYPPFDLSASGTDYEGLTADYAALVAKALGLPIRVERFDSRAAALQALRNGDIDLLGSANGFEASLPDIGRSAAYAEDRPALVTHSDRPEPLAPDLAGLRLSVVEQYLPAAIIAQRYPHAQVQFHASVADALSAVAFGNADVFVGDTLSTYYQIANGYLQNIHISEFGAHEPRGFGFALREADQALLTLVNAALAAIPPATQRDIAQRWSAGSMALLDREALPLTLQERQWVKDNPVVRVAVSEGFAPLTFFDQQGRLRGVSAELLELIRLRTGLRFVAQRSRNVEALMAQVEAGEADIVAALIPSEERRQRLRFSQPYLLNGYALLSANHPQAPQSMADMAHKRLAINRGSALIEYLRSEHPDIQLVEAEDSFRALDLVAQGEADASINPLVTATYFMASHLFQERLRIRTTVGNEQAGFAFAVARGATELGGILDKALASISPQELALVNSRWRGYSPAPDTYWRNYHRLILQITVAASVLVLIAAGWALLTRLTLRRQKQAQRALNDQLALMRALVEGTPHPVYIRDHEGRLQNCNDSYLEAIQAKREAVIDKYLCEALRDSPVQAREVEDDYQRVMREGEPLIVDRTLQMGKRTVTLYHWMLPYRDSTGTVRGIVGGWIDVSERRQLIEKLRSAKDRADSANRAKSTFLATMSHEIRTPLNAVIGLLELALERAERGQLDRNGLQVAHSSARGLLELIGDILDIARIESGHLSISPKRVNLRELVESVVRVFDGVARQKHLELTLHIDHRVQQHDILLDPLRFKQVLSNLLSNAIKFTHHGGVKVEVDLRGTRDPRQWQLYLSVADTGIGISEEDRLRLFKPFAQARSHTAGEQQGAGLGLLICQGLAQAMGASLQLHSTPGQGTTVSLELRATSLEPLAAEPVAVASAHAAIADLTVLVVDDNAANRLLTFQQLEHLGLRAITAQSGEQGLQRWRQRHFDLLMVDCNMPVLNGYELVRTLRREERQSQRPRCTVLGYTANAQPEQLQRCLDAGMDDCLFKPLELRALSERLSRVQPLPGRPASARAALRLDGLELMTQGDPAQIKRLLVQVHSSCQADLQALQALAPSDDPEPVLALAHKIIGAARIVDAQDVCAACRELAALAADPPRLEHGRQQLCRALEALQLDIELSLDSLPGLASAASQG
jgi:two-component system sensor histidine kinase EvgS